jgi:hypothetical protein
MEDLPCSAESEPAVLSRDRMVLVVTAPGIEAEHILPAGREPPPWGTHVAQPWKPVVCSCGEQHTAEDGEFLTLLVGQPQPELRTNKDTFTLAIVPNLDKPPYAGYPYVAPEPDSGPFEEWASKVVANFTGFFVGGGLCTRWDNIRILWDPSTNLLGCGKERDPSQDNVPVCLVPACLPEHARLRFVAVLLNGIPLGAATGSKKFASFWAESVSVPHAILIGEGRLDRVSSLQET